MVSGWLTATSGRAGTSSAQSNGVACQPKLGFKGSDSSAVVIVAKSRSGEGAATVTVDATVQ